MKRGKWVREGTRPEGEKGGKNEGERVGGKGPESTFEKLGFCTPMNLGTLCWPFKTKDDTFLHSFSSVIKVIDLHKAS